jgi:aryl-alcohol dehydrogenase-like predicted oxidoreductase
MARKAARVEKIQAALAGSGVTLPQAAIKFALAHSAMSTVIPGVRSLTQVEANTTVSDLADLPLPLLEKLRAHIGLRGNWHTGK